MGLDNWKENEKKAQMEEENLDLRTSIELLIERDNPMCEIAESLRQRL